MLAKNGVYIFNYFDFFISKADLSNLSQLGRLAGFCCNINLITLANYFEYNVGIGGYTPLVTD